MPANNVIVNKHLHERLEDIFQDSLRLLDTKRDRDILKGIFATSTSVKFTAKLQRVKNRTAIANCRDELGENIEKFRNIEQTSLMVSNNMTNEQQRQLTRRVIQKRKVKELNCKYDSRGRMLKYEQWPDLSKCLEYIFDNQDVTERAGEGLESHPRLKNEIRFRSKDNNTFMRQACEIINNISPPSFNISLSSCYNYTMTYKKNSSAAKRHHHGMDVNAKLSLHRPPHTKVDKLVVNLHYTSANVNYLCDYAAKYPENVLVDSKDAKKIVCADITPVQKPSKLWKDVEYLDHDWDQSRTNAVTPMTHLFLRTDITHQTSSIRKNPTINEVDILSPISDTVLHITRTGTSVTLINPSLLEPETTFRLFHEIFLLLTKPSLDKFFRNSNTGKLKGEFIFVVDNGPAEDPSSHLVQMLMVRMLKFLNLDKVIQVSFAEYHSKRNFVERIHAVEDKLLARHGPFSSNGIHSDVNIVPGSQKHIENMENMSETVINCLQQGRFDDHPLSAFRGVTNSLHIFNDELHLKTFLSYTEEMKETSELTYKVNEVSSMLKDLSVIWNVNENFEGNYFEDYQSLNNSVPGIDYRTAWRDRYITAIYRVDNQWEEKELKRYEFQAIPDYIRWVETKGELHYLPFERLELENDMDWTKTPGLFRPDRLLNLLFTLNSHPLDDMYKHFSFFVWLPESTTRDYFNEKQTSMQHALQEDIAREKWRQHPLYAKKVEELVTLCKKESISTKGKKWQLVERLVQKREGDIPEDYSPNYDGDLSKVANTVTELRKYPVARLRYILNYHGIQTCGTKDEMILRLLLVSQNRYYLCFKGEEGELIRTISLAERIILQQKRQIILHPQYMTRKRTYTKKKCNNYLNVPQNITFQTLENAFKELKDYIKTLKSLRLKKGEELNLKNKSVNHKCSNRNSDDYEEYFCIGKKLKIKWSKEELGNSGWTQGWYSAQVQEGHVEDDTVTVVYFSEPKCVYTLCVSEYLALGKLKFA